MIRLERILDTPRWVRIALPIASLLLAAILSGLVLLLSGQDPIDTYGQIYSASFTSQGALTATFVYMTPLLFTGLGVAVAFRMRVWNIGGEGQLYLGAIGASGIGLLLGNWPSPIVIAAMILAGMAAGALWALIPGILRAYLHTNEILVSLMLNYVAGLLLYLLVYDSKSYWRDLISPSALVFPQGKNLADAAAWPGVLFESFNLPFGLMLGVVLAIALAAVMRTTRFGFEMRVMGDSPSAARYAGIRIRRLILAVMVISGALAGLAGASQIGDFGHVLDPRGLQQAQYGYTGIVVAALALYDPVAIVVVAFLLGALINAGFALQGPTFPAGLVGVMEGIILFSVLGGEILGRYRIRFGRQNEEPAGPDRPPAHAAAPE
jgi:general nucleoside transport system permease protein